MEKLKKKISNLIFPAFLFGCGTGIMTGAVITVYKFVAHHAVTLSSSSYEFVRQNLEFIPLFIIALLGIAILMAFIYKKQGDLKGGGIPTSIGILRGIITFKWFRNLVGTFFLSLVAFLTGVPLGTEGPSVQMGTAIGRGSANCFCRNNKELGTYSMTGGACAGFATATGATLSGITFALEEAHKSISPMIIIVSSIAVVFSRITAELLCPVLGVSVSLIPKFDLLTLQVKDIWIAILVGVSVGLFSVLFLKYYKLLNNFFNKTLKKVKSVYKITGVYVVTFGIGILSFSFISTGHDLILSIFEKSPELLVLIAIILIRSTLTISANVNGLTGGIFLPILALGASFASFIAVGAQSIFGLSESYYTAFLALGITACISGMMKMPLTAIVFSVEALCCAQNVLHVIVVVSITYVICELFGAKSINDSVLERKIERIKQKEQNQGN